MGPNYDVVFPNDLVNQITITIEPDDWEAIQANMVDLFGEAGTGDRGLPGDFQPPADGLPQPRADGFPGGLELPEGSFPQGGKPQPRAEGFEPPEADFPDGAPFNDNGRPGDQFGVGDMTPEIKRSPKKRIKELINMSMKLRPDTVGVNQYEAMSFVDESLVEKVWRDLDKQLPREQVTHVVAEIALKFQDATVKTFLPILIHREAMERLKPLLDG